MAISLQEFLKQSGGTAKDIQVTSSATPAATQSQEPGFLQRTGTIIKDAFSEANQASKDSADGKRNPLSAGLTIAKDIGKVAFAPVTAALEPVTKVASPVVNFVTEKVSDVKTVQNLAMFLGEHPEAERALNDLVETTGYVTGARGAVAGLAKGKAFANSASKQAGQTASGLSEQLGSVKESVKGVVDKTIKPENIMQRVARIPAGAQAKFQQAAGESVGQYLTKRGIYGDTDEIVKQLYDRFTKSKTTADDALAQLKGEFKPTQLKTALQELYDREKRVSSPGAPSKDLTRVKELASKFNKQGLNMSEINEVKRIYERNVRLEYAKQNMAENVARATNIDNAVRSWQFKKAKELGLENLDEINKETQLARTLTDSIGKTAAGQAGNNALSLTDFIVLSGGEPASIATFLGKKALSSKKLQSAVAKKLAGKPTVGEPKARFSPNRTKPQSKR